ncbi:hypothetical protein PRN20_00960 [Devosia sp. ZB163]|uniref:hypothetical protein n=1 Tax=Devosia sp. ZB163 TaxID=3025938 RepID=UPI0023624E32|nr:hypothetical protein [Devosia sp. ZB163]MDC9822285.1 hypothetical protein [Devosia sp. ZB163]
MDTKQLLSSLAVAALLALAPAMPVVAEAHAAGANFVFDNPGSEDPAQMAQARIRLAQQGAPASVAPTGCVAGLYLIDGWCEPRAKVEPAPAGEGAPAVVTRLSVKLFVNRAPAGWDTSPAELTGCVDGLHLIDGWCEPRAMKEPAPAGEGAPVPD